MQRIVHEHYPVAQLPEDLREGLPLDGFARVTIEWEPPESDKNLANDQRLHRETKTVRPK